VSPIGAFTFVLHSHLPYARLAGRWPHGEEWIHEATAETYVPLLSVLYDLREEGVPFRITIGVTPILAEQLDDADIKDHFDQYIDERIESAREDIEFFSAGEHADEHARFLAEWYVNWFERIKREYDDRFGRDLIGALKRLQDEGFIEITTSAATHAYLPLVGRDSTIQAQIATGKRSYERMFGRAPRGIAYRHRRCACGRGGR
jgi:1,4-alpha-glucan branching enzyme